MTIRASNVPDFSQAIVTTLDELDLVLSWSAPIDGGDTIDYYRVMILLPDGVTFVEDMTHCDA